jgi:hypothetical protein
MTKTTNFTRKLRNLTLAVAMAAASAGALAAPALAADWHHGPAGHEDRYHRDYRDYRWHDRFYGPVVAVDPGYGYAPYGYAPPPAPVYVAPPVLSLILPIHIR